MGTVGEGFPEEPVNKLMPFQNIEKLGKKTKERGGRWEFCRALSPRKSAWGKNTRYKAVKKPVGKGGGLSVGNPGILAEKFQGFP